MICFSIRHRNRLWRGGGWYLMIWCWKKLRQSIVDSNAAAEVLFQAAQGQLQSVMPQNNDDFESFIARGRCLRDWMPELKLPEFDDALLREVLRDLCHGRRSFSELKSAPWLAALQSKLDYSLVQTIEREAPERITVPSGSRIRLIYEADRPPVLPVRIQEVFGMKQTPRIASGRIPVLLHLLAPNMRPQQITDDLASFWANTYPERPKGTQTPLPKTCLARRSTDGTGCQERIVAGHIDQRNPNMDETF